MSSGFQPGCLPTGIGTMPHTNTGEGMFFDIEIYLWHSFLAAVESAFLSGEYVCPG